MKAIFYLFQHKSINLGFSPKHLDLKLLVNECVELFDDHARQKSITIHKNVLQETTIFSDHSMISSVMRNLISNAENSPIRVAKLLFQLSKRTMKHVIL